MKLTAEILLTVSFLLEPSLARIVGQAEDIRQLQSVPTVPDTSDFPSLSPSAPPLSAVVTSAPVTGAPVIVTTAPVIATAAPVTAAPVIVTTAPIIATAAPVTAAPTFAPTSSPTASPTIPPSDIPSIVPSKKPSLPPTASPSESPTETPTALPSHSPTVRPSLFPSTEPSVVPTSIPSTTPSLSPTAIPSTPPSVTPTLSPSTTPSLTPTTTPSTSPSLSPTTTPSTTPSLTPTTSPSTSPSLTPTTSPSTNPSVGPTAIFVDAAPIPIPVPVPVPVPVPGSVPSPITTYKLPEIFINAGIDEEDEPYISGEYWASYFNNDILGIPVEFRSVPEAFKSHRSGSPFKYTIPGLLPYASYDVTLGFAENFEELCSTGRRIFNVTVNGKPFASNLDVYEKVGCYGALVLKKAYKANTDGKIIITFTAIKRNPFVSLIGIDPNGPIKSLSLCKAENQTILGKLGNDYAIDLEVVGTNMLSIVATADDAITRVRFRYNGIVHVEHVVPYAMNGNDGGDFNPVPYLSTAGNKTIWVDAINDDKETIDTVRIDLKIIGGETFEEEGDNEIIAPSILPSTSPSDVPSSIPSDVPSSMPSDVPSSMPSDAPSDAPSAMPSDAPSAIPSATPSAKPSAIPSDSPSALPTDAPSAIPSDGPSGLPSDVPSSRPSDAPSRSPSLV